MRYSLSNLKDLRDQLRKIESSIEGRLDQRQEVEHRAHATVDEIKSLDRNIRRMRDLLKSEVELSEDVAIKDSVVNFIVDFYNLEVKTDEA